MSFTDLMSSGRGPGVIGTVLALVVLLGFGVLSIFVFDESLQGGDQTIESIIRSQTKDIDYMQGKLESGKSQLGNASTLKLRNDELEKLKREKKSQATGIAALAKDVTKGTEQLAAMHKEFDAYKDEYRAVARAKAKGQTMDRLVTRKGVTYENVMIREVTPIGIQIRSNDGFVRIAFEDLPDAIQDQFQFDSSQKAAAIAKENSEREQHEKIVAAAEVVAGSNAAEHKKREAAETRRKALQSIAQLQTRIKSLSDQIESLELAIPKESLKRISRAPIMQADLTNKKATLDSLQAEVSRLQSMAQ